MKRFLGLGGIAFLFLIAAGCGDVFRPIIIPNPPTFPDPRAAHTVMLVNANPMDAAGDQVAPGNVTVVDVSGDSIIGVANVGVAPVHAVQQTANQVLVVNQATSSAGAASLSKINFSGTTISGKPSLISLPADSAPNFVAAAPFDPTAYVSLPNLFLDPVNHPGKATVAVVNTTSSAVVATLMVGNQPAALAVTPDKTKMYVANSGDNTLSAFNTVDRSARAISGSLSAAPIWLSPRSDSQRVYVLESNGVLAYLDTTTTAGPDLLTVTSISVPGATHMTYDGHLNRLYIVGGTQAVIVDVSQSAPKLFAPPINITAVQPSARITGDPCATTAVSNLSAVAAAALPDGSRAYIAAYYEDASGNVCPQVTVINASSGTVKTAAPIPGFANYDALCAATRFRFAMAAAGDSSRAYLAACDGGNINAIDTSTDTFIAFLQTPPSGRPPIPPNTQPPPQNPVFLIAGP